MLLHASCVAVGDKGVLIAGDPGAGKSDLALRLIDGGAQLVSDDQTELRVDKNKLIASAPEAIRGLMEVRHVGLLKLPFRPQVVIALYIDLAPLDKKLERLPDEVAILLLDRTVPRLRLPSFAASTPAKIRAALSYPLVTDTA